VVIKKPLAREFQRLFVDTRAEPVRHLAQPLPDALRLSGLRYFFVGDYRIGTIYS